MDKTKLIATGLSAQQAEAYALLIEKGQISPPIAAKTLNLTRTNAYKVFDKLVELGLANKSNNKRSIYSLNNPMALATLVARHRANTVLREEAVNSVMGGLLAEFYKHNEQPSVEVVSGKQAIADTYRKQIGLKEDIYFIHTPLDVATMGFDTMHEIRTAPALNSNQRRGILTAPADDKVNWESHKRSNLEITWAPKKAYDSPVEWSVTKSSLLIILYANEPHAILIIDKVIASAFIQLWSLMSTLLKQLPTHQALSSK